MELKHETFVITSGIKFLLLPTFCVFMLVLNKEQSAWFRKNFCLSTSDFPTDFYTLKEFIEIICGVEYIRGKDYLGDSMSFVDDCLMSLYARDTNKKKFEFLFNQLHNYWIKEATDLEFYELLANLNELNELFIEFVKNANDHKVDIEVKSLLDELGFNSNPHKLPF